MQRSTFQARRAALTRREWRSLAGMGAVVVGLHVAGFVILIAVVAPHHYALGSSGAFTVGLGLTAYTLGLRHAFDADHIAAIDNTTRKLMAERQRPLSVGFWFSLGHSSIVFGLAVLFAVGIRALQRARPQRRLGAAPRHRAHRDRRLRRLPVRHRGAQPGRADRDPARVPRDAPAAASTRPSSSAGSTPAAS